MLQIYTDTQWITDAHRKIVFPLLFDVCYTKNPGFLMKFHLVPHLESADVVIVPLEIGFFYKTNQLEWLHEFIDAALRSRKPVWVYTAGDLGITLTKPVYTFRLGGFDSKMNENTFVLPSFINNPYLNLEKDFCTIAKQVLPKIGFVGNASGSKLKRIKEFFIFLKQQLERSVNKRFDDLQPFYSSSTKRFQYLKQLESNSQIETDFIYRNQYRAGVRTAEEKRITTEDFFSNMARNPYIFCLRGAGNFSVRFYETLAMGRIPVVIATDFRLPLKDIIDWNQHCLVLQDTNLEKSLIDFHKSISPEAFEQMQIANRKLWLECLNLEAYFTAIAAFFKDKIK